MCAQTSKQNITIKKYANRRLYNTATSSYVTLEDLCAMVKGGETFNVYDAKTSEDITRSVLTQIIVEEENKTGQQNLLPISFLRQLIGFYGDKLQWMVPKYLEHSMEMFTGNQEQIRDYYKTTFGGMFPFGTTLEDMGKQNMSMFENTLRMFAPFNLSTMLGGTTEESTVASSCCATTGTGPVSKTSCCKPTTNSNTITEERNEKTVSPMASVTSIKPRAEFTASSGATTAATAPTSTTSATPSSSASPTTTPMPNVANATTSSSSGADDMQQKIANLQRQLADLAKSRG